MNMEAMEAMEVMDVLNIGSGGREHAVAWKLRQSPYIRNIYTAPGNGATHDPEHNMWNVDIDAKDIDKLAAFASDKSIGLTIPGPEDPLALGIVDVFSRDFLPIWGPTQKAAELESKKAETVEFLERNHIPHPKSKIFKDFGEAKEYISKRGPKNIVIKASGLALGKGVSLPDTEEEAVGVLTKLMIEGEYKGAGKTVVIQDREKGPEISIIAHSDGRHVVPFLPAQDHKRAHDDDKGPNTGGMGAYAPVPFVTPGMLEQIQNTILQPTIDAMWNEDNPFIGVLYAGLILTEEGPKVLEFNVRYGDPEIQPLLRLFDKDLAVAIMASIQGKLKPEHISFSKGAAACVVLASGGYPGEYKKGRIIEGIDRKYPNAVIFQAGTKMENGVLVTSGGRVLDVTGYGVDVENALAYAYRAIGRPEGVGWEGMEYRRDIGKQAIMYSRNA
jgi:phosphoribosylamine--glycine ligase